MIHVVAMQPEYAIGYYEKRANLSSDEIRAASEMFPDDDDDILSISGDVATIKVKGVLSPDGPDCIDRFCGFSGTSYHKIIEACEKVGAVSEVRFITDTPGGTVKMVDETYYAIAKLRNSKRVVFENHGTIASAGMWLASAAHEIVATSPTVETGSIGVKVVGFDFTGAYKEMGVKKVVVLSDNAPAKAGLDSKDGIEEARKQVNALENIFISRVADGRGVTEDIVKKEFGRGGLLVASNPGGDDAVSVGMIDRVDEGILCGVSETLQRAVICDNGVKLKREINMSLKDFLAENKDANAEFEAAVSAAHADGVKQGKANVEARVKSASKFLSADSAYPEAVTSLAVKVISGDADIMALTATVAAVDAVNEQAKSRAAAEDTRDIGDTSAQDHTLGNSAHDIKSEEDYQAAVNAARIANGLEALS